MMDAFNEVLDRLKAGRPESVFALEALGISDDTLRSYRRGRFPKKFARLLQYPDLLEALAQDVRAKTAATHQYENLGENVPAEVVDAAA